MSKITLDCAIAAIADAIAQSSRSGETIEVVVEDAYAALNSVCRIAAYARVTSYEVIGVTDDESPSSFTLKIVESE